jgi:hypothetical protein
MQFDLIDALQGERLSWTTFWESQAKEALQMDES